MQAGKSTVIDVRNEDEIQATGVVMQGPTVAHTLPLPAIREGAFGLPEEEFESRFGFPKPKPGDEIIMTCRAGRRSVTAAEIAAQHGYRHLFSYKGGANASWRMGRTDCSRLTRAGRSGFPIDAQACAAFRWAGRWQYENKASMSHL
jgi:rhodanese-related sulfurtransferase